MKHPVSQTLFAYWNNLRSDRIAPRRFEIEPSSIASILPDTLILERIDPEVSRFRLAGTRITEAFGVEFRGVNILDLFGNEDRLTLQRQLSISARQGAIGCFAIKAETSTGRAVAFEMTLLPLTHTRNLIDRFVGSIAAHERPDWIGSVPLKIQRITAHDIFWPDGRSHAMIDNSHRQSPFLPHLKEARVVRSDRRQFRVYDGGLNTEHDDKS